MTSAYTHKFMKDKSFSADSSADNKTITANIVKRSLLSENELQPLWAAYFNMARYNMYTTLVHIATAVGLSDDENMENRMDKMKILNEPVEPEIEHSLRKLLCRHFPFAVWICSPIGKKDSKKDSADEDYRVISVKELRDCLKTVSFTLNSFRNYYSHSRNVETRSEAIIRASRNSEKQTGIFLKKVCTVATRRVKSRFSDKNNKGQAGMIDDQSMKFITEGKVKLRNNNGEKEIINNPDYFLNPLFLDRSSVLRDGTNPERLSTVGKIQLICLLLDKKYITEFLYQSGFLSAFDNDAPAPRLSERRLILEVLSDLRIRLPKRKIDATCNDIQVALDMLNELKKCPKELFELLEAKDRATFDILSSTGEHILLRRSSDRFTQLALQWFDVNKAFSRIRFQMNAGIFRYLFNDRKTCIDGKTRLRVLQEPLNCFGRIQEVEDSRESNRDGNDGPWKGFEIKGFDEAARNDVNCLPYINDSRTRYLITEDNIGIRFSGDDEACGDYFPRIDEKNGRYKVTCLPAQCMISIYELQAMLFLHLLNPGNDGGIAPVEKIIIDKVDSYRRFFTDINNGLLTPSGLTESSLNDKLTSTYGISLSDIPDKMKDYLLKKDNKGSGFKAYRDRLIETLKEETEYRIKRLEENLQATNSDTNKPGRSAYVQIKPGSLASFISKDIVFFQECNADQKMTGLNFSVMQGLIATFGSQEGATADDLRMAFCKSGLIAANGSCGTHPFLAMAFNAGAKNTVDLYKEYLNARKTYLSGIIPDNAPFLHADRIRWAVNDDAYYKDYAERCLQRPVILPRRLFESSIRANLLSLEGKNADLLKEVINNAGNHCNSAFMIDSYFYYIKDDSPQVFHGACEGDMIHTYGHRFFQVVRRNLKNAEAILSKLEKDSNTHKIYIGALSDAISWAKKNTVAKSASSIGKSSCKEHSEDEIALMIKRAFNEYMETEKTLRRYVIQDELLFLAAMKTVQGKLGINGNKWRLGNIGPKSKSILDETVPSIKTPAKFSHITKRPHNIIETDLVECVIEQTNVCIKDYGDIYRILADERLYGLLRYHKNETILESDLKGEIEAYDNRRVGVFTDIMKYEHKITKGITDMQLCETMGQIKAKSINFNVMQEFDTVNNNVTKTKLKSIRNAFCHNSYPEKDLSDSSHKNNGLIHNANVPGAAEEISEIVKNITSNTVIPTADS